MKLREELRELILDRLAWISTTISISLPVLISLLLDIRGEINILILAGLIFFIVFTTINSIYILVAKKTKAELLISKTSSLDYLNKNNFEERLTARYPLLQPYAKVSLAISGIFLISAIVFYPSRNFIFNSILITPSPYVIVSTASPTATEAVNSIFDLNKACSTTAADNPVGNRFQRDQGISLFSVENSAQGTFRNNTVRALVIDQNGLWMGYYQSGNEQPTGLELFNKVNWYGCDSNEIIRDSNINDLAIDRGGRIWASLEHKGVATFDGRVWKIFTKSDGLPSNDIFRITVDENNNIWVGTWEGVAKYDGLNWSTPYTVQDGLLSNNHVAIIKFDDDGNIWVGHIDRGISLFNNKTGQWIYFQSEKNGLGGNKIRAIAIQDEDVWIATADGGVSKYNKGTWTQYHVNNGLPSEDIRDIQIDPLNRIWIATSKGTAYLEDGKWKIYTTFDTARLAFGITCKSAQCPYDTDHIWTATSGFGITHSRLPQPDMIDISEVCFIIDNSDRYCVNPTATDQDNIEAKLPFAVSEGQKVRFEITVSPRYPYQLREDRGDFLSFTEKSDENMFGAYPLIAAKGIIDSGQKYIFTDFDSPLIMPKINSKEQEITSTWRIWLFTRYAGSYINLKFIVKSP
jgi:hypothetical protein